MIPGTSAVSQRACGVVGSKKVVFALRAAEAGHESVADELAAALGDEGDARGLRIRVARQGGGRAGGCARRSRPRRRRLGRAGANSRDHQIKSFDSARLREYRIENQMLSRGCA